jgi:copper chaperone CopZ
MTNMRGLILTITATIYFVLPASTHAQSTDTVKKIEVKVTNLHCGNDMPTIKKRLLNQEGIDEVKFTDLTGESSMFTITYHTAATTQPQIEKAIETTPGCDDKSSTPYRVKRKKTKS